jgi:nitrate reductase NapAB chaperone NapD
MSEQQQPNETKVNDELTERANKALVAIDYTFLAGSGDHVVIISAGDDDNRTDVLMTLKDMEDVVSILRDQADEEKLRNE